MVDIILEEYFLFLQEYYGIVTTEVADCEIPKIMKNYRWSYSKVCTWLPWFEQNACCIPEEIKKNAVFIMTYSRYTDGTYDEADSYKEFQREAWNYLKCYCENKCGCSGTS